MKKIAFKGHVLFIEAKKLGGGRTRIQKQDIDVYNMVGMRNFREISGKFSGSNKRKSNPNPNPDANEGAPRTLWICVHTEIKQLPSGELYWSFSQNTRDVPEAGKISSGSKVYEHLCTGIIPRRESTFAAEHSDVGTTNQIAPSYLKTTWEWSKTS